MEPFPPFKGYSCRNTTDNKSYILKKNYPISGLKLKRKQYSNISTIKVPDNIRMSLEEYESSLIDILLTGGPFRFLLL